MKKYLLVGLLCVGVGALASEITEIKAFRRAGDKVRYSVRAEGFALENKEGQTIAPVAGEIEIYFVIPPGVAGDFHLQAKQLQKDLNTLPLVPIIK